MTGQYIRASARKLGIAPEEYAARVDAGEKWCSHCRSWHDRKAFGPDASTTSGLAGRCRDADAELGRRRRARRASAPFMARIWTSRDDETRTE